MASSLQFFVHRDALGSWRWRLSHRGGNMIAESTNGHAHRDCCLAEIARINSKSDPSPIIEDTTLAVADE